MRTPYLQLSADAKAFWLLRHAVLIPKTFCWEWTGTATQSGGYCAISVGSRKEGNLTNLRVHRASWLLFCGDIPTGLIVCHHCDNPKCINPEHLFLGTNADNTKDMIAKGRQRFPHPQPGADHPCARITPAQIKQILDDRGPAWRVAAKIGMSTNTVYAVRNGRHWSAPNRAGRRQ